MIRTMHTWIIRLLAVLLLAAAAVIMAGGWARAVEAPEQPWVYDAARLREAREQCRLDLVAAKAAMETFKCQWRFSGHFGNLACQRSIRDFEVPQVLAAAELVHQVRLMPWKAWTDNRNFQVTFQSEPSPFPDIWRQVIYGETDTIEAPMR